MKFEHICLTEIFFNFLCVQNNNKGYESTLAARYPIASKEIYDYISSNWTNLKL